MSTFVEKIKKIFDEEIVNKNQEIAKLNQLLILEKEKLQKIQNFIKDTMYETHPPEFKRIPVVRGFPSRAAGDPDDEFNDIRR